MSQIAKLTATIAAGASDQAVPHGLALTPMLVYIVEKDEGAGGVQKALQEQSFAAVGAAIGSDASKVKTVAAAVYTVLGVMYAKGATDDFWVLTGFDVTNGKYNVCLLCIDTSNNMKIAAGTEADTLVAVVLADTPADSCVVATLEVNPDGTGDFTGGSIDLDDGTVVPNAVFLDVSGHPEGFGKVTMGKAADGTNVYLDNTMQRARDVEIIAFALA